MEIGIYGDWCVGGGVLLVEWGNVQCWFVGGMEVVRHST